MHQYTKSKVLYLKLSYKKNHTTNKKLYLWSHQNIDHWCTYVYHWWNLLHHRRPLTGTEPSQWVAEIKLDAAYRGDGQGWHTKQWSIHVHFCQTDSTPATWNGIPTVLDNSYISLRCRDSYITTSHTPGSPDSPITREHRPITTVATMRFTVHCWTTDGHRVWLWSLLN